MPGLREGGASQLVESFTLGGYARRELSHMCFCVRPYVCLGGCVRLEVQRRRLHHQPSYHNSLRTISPTICLMQAGPTC